MRRGQIEVYRDHSGEWRWRWRARNGRVTAVSSEGYERRGGAVRGARATVGLLASVVEVQWSDEGMPSLDPLDEAKRSADRAARRTALAEKRTQRAQEQLDEIQRLTGLGD